MVAAGSLRDSGVTDSYGTLLLTAEQGRVGRELHEVVALPRCDGLVSVMAASA